MKDFVELISPLKSGFTNDPETKKLIRQVLIEFGCDLEKTYFDAPRIRIVTSDNYLTAGVGYAYKAHRDTWYSSPQGLSKIIDWYLNNKEWMDDVTSGNYQHYYDEQYVKRK